MRNSKTSQTSSNVRFWPSLAEKAARDLSSRRLKRRSEAPSLSLVDYVPHRTKHYSRPYHLEPLTSALELAASGVPQFVVVHAPPRFAKSETIAHFPAYVAERYPEKTVGYAAYGQRLTVKTSKSARRIMRQAGLELVTDTQLEARLPQGGGFLATTTTGALTGFGIDVMIIDDAVKTRAEAESPTYRARLEDWYNDVVATRIEPGGSVFYVGTRWREDDLPAYLIREHGFRYVCLPALSRDASGVERSLWPERWPTEVMQEKREKTHDYTWQSLFQGSPRPRGARVFQDAQTYTQAPTVYRGAFGLDLSYAAKKTSDYSVVVDMRRQGEFFYVVNVVRLQVPAPEFKSVCYALHTSHKSARWRWYAAGTETGSADFFRNGAESIPLTTLAPKGDKFARALNYAAAYNSGRVLVPESAPWLSDFLEEHAGFTGTGDKHDDIIDAAVAAFDELADAGSDFTRAEPMPATRRSEFEPTLL